MNENFTPLNIGDEVERGPDWRWYNQDIDSNGKPTTGKVTCVLHPGSTFNVVVKWSHGIECYYHYNEKRKDVIPVKPAITEVI